MKIRKARERRERERERGRERGRVGGSEGGKNLGGVELVKNGHEGSGEIWSVSDLADASLDAPLSYLFVEEDCLPLSPSLTTLSPSLSLSIPLSSSLCFPPSYSQVFCLFFTFRYVFWLTQK